MSLSPFFLFIQTPCHSPPLTSRAKGRSKPRQGFCFPCKSDVYWSYHAPPEFTLYFQWSTWPYDFSYHLGLIHTSKIQPSGFTYKNQVPNQVGLHISTQLPNQVGLQNLTQLPNQVGLQNLQVLTWLNITILHHGSQQDLFHKLQKWPFNTNTRNSSRKRTYFRTIIMPTMHYTQQR